MADKQTASGFWQRLSKRERFFAVLTVMAALSWAIYEFPYTMQVKAVASLEVQLVAVEKEILDITAQITDLAGRAAEIKAGGQAPTPSRRWDLVDQKDVVLLLEDVSGEARRLGVSLVAVHPSQEVDKEQYKEVAMDLDLRARYRELAEYFKRLENLPRVVNVRKIRVESCPDTASVCTAHLEAVTYLAK